MTPKPSPVWHYKKSTLDNTKKGIDQVAKLYCFECNENLPACSVPTLNLTRLLLNHLEPCHGQCMQYQNQFDNYSKTRFFLS